MARYNALRVMQWQGFLYSPYGLRRSCTPRRRQTPNPSFFQPEGTKPLYVEKRMRSTAHSATLPIAEAFTPGKVFWCTTLPPSRDQDEPCWKAQRGQNLSWLTSLGEKKPPGRPPFQHMSYGLNSSKWFIQEIIYGSIIGVIKGDTRSLDYNPHNPLHNPIYSSFHFIFHLILHY